MSAVPSLPESIVNGEQVSIHQPASQSENTNGQVNDHAKTNGYVNGHTNGINGHTQHREFQLYDEPVENFRKLKVIVIGAGYSGIYCGIRIPERLRNVDLVIYDKNAGIGGTWYENRYPGCACDIPSHSYQYSFEPNHSWSSLYAPAYEIQAYLERTAKKYSADRFMKLSHKIQECRYDQGQGKWHVKVEDLTTGNVFEDSADVLISARGNLNNIAWPDIEGLRSFKGEIMHSAQWNQDYDFKNKRIGVIGSGSSAIQIVPSLQRVEGTQLSCFVRSQTWISPPFGQEMWDKLGLDSFNISDAQKARFAEDPQYYAKFRLAIEEDGNSIHAVTQRGTPMQLSAQAAFEDHMRSRLAADPTIFEALLPSFAPGCRRLTPGPGFLEALVKPNVDFITTPITRVEEKGVRTKDGKLHELDVLVCATGFHTSAPPPFPVIGLDGLAIQDHWSQRASSYLSVATDKFPNHFMMLGPNSAIGTGSLTMMIESVGDYITKCVRKMQKENVKSMAVLPARVSDFSAYVDAYFTGTVFTDKCKSWYRNKDNKITGLWPGSTLHCIEALRSPRWEDYVYEHVGDGEGAVGEVNRLAWLGNGWSVKQLPPEEKDLAWYLYPEFLDQPTAPFPEKKGTYKVRPFSH